MPNSSDWKWLSEGENEKQQGVGQGGKGKAAGEVVQRIVTCMPGNAIIKSSLGMLTSTFQ